MKSYTPYLFVFLVAIATSNAQTIRLDAHSPGRTFDGLGALSAGASSRLLMDYPEPQRSQILDYLFKPNYGAALQHLKVEIGADVNSTDGSEPSHMRSARDHDDSRGYEWWLMREARKRNPAIVLDTLSWGAPGWIGNGKFYSHDMAEYVATFLEGAKKQGLDVAYTGVWNERKPDYDWVKLLRKTLDEHHLATKIVCCDGYPGALDPYAVADAMDHDPQLAKAVDVIGIHYAHSRKTGLAPDAVIRSGRTIWSSEDQPNPGGGPFLSREWKSGGRVLARLYNENYIDGKMTATEIWSPITSYYDNLAAPNSGLMYANTPWSGYYDVQSAIWVTAHTTQFAKPGWTYMDTASGFLPDGQGSYVSLRAPAPRGKAAEWSVVLETTQAKAPQRLIFHVGEGLSTARVHIWETSGNKTFEKIADLDIKNHALEYTFEPDAIFSITTTTGQRRGSAQPPAAAPFPFPYHDDFERTSPGRAARYLADQDGAFEAQPCAGRTGQCLAQVITQKPIAWLVTPEPFTMAGNADWKDYRVGADFMLPEEGSVMLIGRIDSADVFKDRKALYPSAYIFRSSSDGTWQLLSTHFKQAPKVLASGAYPSSPGWHHHEMAFQGPRITVLVDGKVISSVENTEHAGGMIGLGSGWNHAQFDNLSITPN